MVTSSSYQTLWNLPKCFQRIHSHHRLSWHTGRFQRANSSCVWSTENMLATSSQWTSLHLSYISGISWSKSLMFLQVPSRITCILPICLTGRLQKAKRIFCHFIENELYLSLSLVFHRCYLYFCNLPIYFAFWWSWKHIYKYCSAMLGWHAIQFIGARFGRLQKDNGISVESKESMIFTGSPWLCVNSTYPSAISQNASWFVAKTGANFECCIRRLQRDNGISVESKESMIFTGSPWQCVGPSYPSAISQNAS